MTDTEVQETWRFRRPSMIYLHNRWAKTRTRSADEDEKFDLALSLFPSCRQFFMVVKGLHRLERVEATVSATISAVSHLHTFSLAIHDCYNYLGIFKGGGSQIKKVYLTNYYTDLTSPVFRNLSELSVGGHPVIHFPPMEWLQLLARLNRLEKLQLDNCFKGDTSVGTEVIQATYLSSPVCLPVLRSFEIIGDQASCTNILAHLDISPVCDMRVHVWGVRDNGYLVPMTKSFNQKLAARSGAQKVPGLFVQLWPNRIFFTNIHHTLDDMILSFSWRMDRAGYDDIPVGLISSFGTAMQAIGVDVTDLYLDTWEDETLDLFLEVLGQLRNVNHLRVANNHTLNTLIGLNLDCNRRGRQLLPALSMILLYKLEFNAQQSVDDIISFLYQRYDDGIPVQSIKLKCCQGTSVKALVDELEILGAQVHWDRDCV